MDKYDFYRTDLLVENEEMVRHRTEKEKEKLKESEGIQFDETRKGRVILTSVKINAEGEKRIGKKRGTYLTLTNPTLTHTDREGLEEMGGLLKSKLTEMTKEIANLKNGKILLVGLGNREVTPDAVGPLTMDRLKEIVPMYYSDEGSELFVYAPGVTIQTGLETADFVKAIVHEIKPDVIIVVDALAARDSSRLCKTIQMTDTGIHPGSGVGNSRKELSKETLGIPVIAIGIPTVVDGPVLIADAINTLFNYIATKIEEESHPSSRLSVSNWLHTPNKDADRTKLIPIFGDWTSWPHEERVQLFEEVLSNHDLNTFISPKEIDSWAALYAEILTDSISEWIQELKTSH
ncbi:GPR endopeptidase [Sporosarcina thermotolerans]|uniref:Germination protease n=1 Tax=Sporosarcina thermotolerans TaxID=633404 RepID=A0AAW9A8N3_9BACL|nr:GPR endopeptidase [Sporosarcina thermotolerans]MDW0117404.1 GPR endopeptidase [Sporosarcina thermotolerans]